MTSHLTYVSLLINNAEHLFRCFHLYLLFGKVSSKLLPMFYFIFFLKVVFIFRDGEEREGERERNIDWLPLAHPRLGTRIVTQAWALMQNQTRNFSVHRLVLNPQSHIYQGVFCLILIMFVFGIYWGDIG